MRMYAPPARAGNTMSPQLTIESRGPKQQVRAARFGGRRTQVERAYRTVLTKSGLPVR
jgi:hypothetical protein